MKKKHYSAEQLARHPKSYFASPKTIKLMIRNGDIKAKIKGKGFGARYYISQKEADKYFKEWEA
jgi:hypothetical protein